MRKVVITYDGERDVYRIVFNKGGRIALVRDFDEIPAQSIRSWLCGTALADIVRRVDRLTV